MNKTIYTIASLIMALVMILANPISTKAAGNAYYVSPTGKDTNPGTASAPFKTFAKANSVLTPGSTLYVYAGIYNQQLKITQSGTSSEGITIQPVGGKAIIDMANAAVIGLDIRGSYVTVSGLEVRRSNEVCVNLGSSNITLNGLIVHECWSHGIQANNASNIQILNSGVFRTVLQNKDRNLSSGWGSGIKVRVSDNVLIQGNIVYNNYGEGIGTRGTNITIRANTVYDNFSVNIYTNSENALIERNFVYCTPNSGFERNGLPAVGIGMGEEYFEGWGARLRNARVFNNIVSFCRHGVRYSGAEAGVAGGGLKYSAIAYNTLYGSTNAAISIVYGSAQAGSLIANNIIWQAENNLAIIDNPVGITFQNNLWKAQPPAAFRSAGDRTGDPQISASPVYLVESYRPASTSPAIGGAADLSISQDYFAQQRGPSFDIGAIQLGGGSVAAITQAVASATPTQGQPTSTALTPQTTASPLPATAQATSTPVAASPTVSSPAASATVIPPTATATSVAVVPTTTLPPVQPSAQAPKETQFDSKESVFRYSNGWIQEASKPAVGGSYSRTSTNGASVTLQFTGQSFSIIYKGGPSYRKMDVYIDGALVGTIDQRHDVSTYKARWDYPGTLPAGQHTLQLVFVSTSSTNNGSVDAVIVR